MMKRLRYSLLAILALFTLTVSCVDPLEPVPVNQSSIPDNALVFSPKVLGITPATKTTPGEANRGENAVTRLDVFVYKTTGGSVEFLEHYTIGDGSTEIDTGVDHLLESNWRTKYTTTDTYRIYAIANINANKITNPELPLPYSPTETELLSLTSESDATITGQYGYTCYDIVRLKNLEGTIPAKDGSLDHHISNKLFLMDGKIDNWMVDPNATKQYFTQYPGTDATNYPNFELSRAAAKFRVELDFSTNFKKSLGTDDGTGLKFTEVLEYYPLEDGQTEDQKQAKTVRVITIGSIIPADATGSYANGVVTGGARAKFANIMKATYDIAPSGTTPSATEQTTFRDANLWDSQSFYEFSYRTPNGTYGTGTNAVKLYKYPYVDTTYSYAFSWDAAQAAEKAPALAVSIVYTTYIQKYKADGSFDGPAESDGGVTNYYRIPLVDIVGAPEDATTNPVTPARDPVNAVERNYYYQVKAEINTMGTSVTDIDPNKVHLKYKIIPWPDAPTEKTEAQTIQLLYFVPEKEYSLRGDDLQSVYLQYFTPKSDPIAVNSHYYQATPKIKNVEVYYYNQSGQKHYLQQKTSTVGYSTDGYKWVSSTSSGADASIEVLTNDQQTGGRFYVASTALENRSVKFIEFDAEVNFGYAGGQTVTQHIIVKHFPLDNLNSILGAWSSRWNERSTSTTITEYSFNPSADGWDSWDGYTDNVECTLDEYNAAEPEHRSTSTQTSTRPANREDFLNNVTANTDRANANSETNAVNGYWGTNPSYVTYVFYNNASASISDNWDYWTHYYNGYNYGNDTYIRYKYSNYYTKAPITTYKARRYYRTRTINQPSTGNWVDWDAHTGTVYNSDGFTGKYWGAYYPDYGGGEEFTYNMTGASSGEPSNSESSRLRNNHMYVIQISKAGKDSYGNDVILGRPVIDDNHQSLDNTVSPAFMIASQLGAISRSEYTNNTTGADRAKAAATHCGTYMEVAKNGRRFVNWRLPTQAEIAYIVQYQTDLAGTDVFDTVLTGYWYYTLNYTSGQDDNKRRAHTNVTNTEGNYTYVRCIRDLTPEEVIELNSETGTITTASY